MIKAVGVLMLGMFNSSHWAHDMANAENRRFVADFQKEYGRLPSLVCLQGYDAALMIDAAVRDVKGRFDDKDAVRKALEAKISPVRVDFKFNTNHHPVQNYYLRVIGKDQQTVSPTKPLERFSPIMSTPTSLSANEVRLQAPLAADQ